MEIEDLQDIINQNKSLQEENAKLWEQLVELNTLYVYARRREHELRKSKTIIVEKRNDVLTPTDKIFEKLERLKQENKDLNFEVLKLIKENSKLKRENIILKSNHKY
jgi:regulator of replication initiation timing